MEEVVYYYKNYDLEFNVPEKEANEWYLKVYELGEKGDAEGVTELFKQANELYFDEYHIYNTIQQLTNDNAEKTRLLKQLKECKIVKKIKTYKDGTIVIVTKKDKDNNIPDIIVTRLSDFILDLKEEDNDLGTWERQGKCHAKSKEISLRLTFPNEVVTGYFHSMSDKARFLHSWVEFSQNGKDYVIDYTMNIVMNKRGYYFIRHIEELCRISDTDILSDLELFSQLKGLNIKEYMVYRHEIAKELKEKGQSKVLKPQKVNKK